MGQFILLANFLLFAAVRNTPGLYESFGFTHDRPALVAFLLFQLLMAPMDEVGTQISVLTLMSAPIHMPRYICPKVMRSRLLAPPCRHRVWTI